MQDRRLLLKAEKFNVSEFYVTGRDDVSERHTILEHPGAAVILPILDDDTVVLIRNKRWPIDQTLWELPAGTLDPGESPDTCAARELEEETGYRAASLRPLVEIFPCAGISTEKMSCYVATDLQPGQQSLDQTEEIEVHPKSRADVQALIRAREIPDAKTLAILLMWLGGLTD